MSQEKYFRKQTKSEDMRWFGRAQAYMIVLYLLFFQDQ